MKLEDVVTDIIGTVLSEGEDAFSDDNIEYFKGKIRKWAKMTVPESKTIMSKGKKINIRFSDWNNCRKEMIKNIEEQ